MGFRLHDIQNVPLVCQWYRWCSIARMHHSHPLSPTETHLDAAARLLRGPRSTSNPSALPLPAFTMHLPLPHVGYFHASCPCSAIRTSHDCPSHLMLQTCPALFRKIQLHGACFLVGLLQLWKLAFSASARVGVLTTLCMCCLSVRTNSCCTVGVLGLSFAIRAARSISSIKILSSAWLTMYSRSAGNRRGFSVWHTAPSPMMPYLHSSGVLKMFLQFDANL